MIYQILFVFALLIVASNNASEERLKKISMEAGHFPPEILTKEDIPTMNAVYKEKIGWSSEHACSSELSKGIYGAYKKDGDELKLFKTCFVEDRADIDLSKVDGFKLDDTYVIYGVTHKDIKVNAKVNAEKKDVVTMANWESLDKTGFKFIRSSEKCFKKGVIINIVIVVVVVLVLCALCVFRRCYLKKQREEALNKSLNAGYVYDVYDLRRV